MTWRIHKDPVTIRFIFLLIIIGILTYIEYKLNIDKEIIIVSITVISATIGYFITHFLDSEQKKREEKIKLYQRFVKDIRVFIKGSADKEGAAKKFEDTYYESWLFISTKAYEKLVDYIEQYKVWADNKSEENKKALNRKLVLLMQEVRDEVTIDTPTEFKNYDMGVKG